MTKRELTAGQGSSTMDLTHLRREARTALELAVVAMVPEDLLQRLAACTGLLEAVAELPADSPPLLTIVPKLISRTREALGEWKKWQSHLPQAG